MHAGTVLCEFFVVGVVSPAAAGVVVAVFYDYDLILNIKQLYEIYIENIYHFHICSRCLYCWLGSLSLMSICDMHRMVFFKHEPLLHEATKG